MFASFPEHIAGYHVFRRLSMPRHPPYTLSSLTTFIDHRHERAVHHGRQLQRRGKNSPTSPLPRSITCHIAKKVLDDIRSISPTKRLPWGSRQCRMNRVTSDIAEDHSNCSSLLRRDQNRLTPSSAGSNEPFKPLNLTYSLVKELTACTAFRVEHG